MHQHFKRCRISAERIRFALCGLLAAAFSATAQPRAPAEPWTPWSVESPGPLGARFGLGLDLALDRLDDAEVVAGTQRVTTIAADGSRQTTVAPVDVGLTNRKHGQGWEERWLGFQAPVALPPFHLGALRVEPSLVLEAAVVEGELTFVDRVEGESDRALDGTAARWGVGVEALGELCRACRWFWSAGYRYRSLGGLDLDGERQGDPGGPTVTQSAEIDHDSHHLTARLGALLAGGRATAYVGVRERRSDLEVTDETTVRSPPGGPNDTTVLTRLDLDADDTVALAGTDFRLGRGYFGRVEATFGSNGEGLLLKVVRAPWVGSPEERPRVVEKQRRRAEKLADAIAPRVDALRRWFSEQVDELERQAGPGQPLPTAGVMALVDDTERELSEILAAPELQPILAWFVVDLFAGARRDLESSRTVEAGRTTAGPPAFSDLRWARAAVPARQRIAGSPQRSSRAVLDAIRQALDDLFDRSDGRKLTTELCVRSTPYDKVEVTLSAPLTGAPVEKRTTTELMQVTFRGLYAYTAKASERKDPIACSDPQKCPLLNLWRDEGPIVLCRLPPAGSDCRLQRGELTECPQ